MASTEKFTDDAMCNMLRHNERATLNPSNKDIDKSKRDLNYSFDLEHGGLTDYQYYKKLVGDKYLYGRGTKREKDAVTGCGWVVTCPKEIYGNQEKEKQFFEGVFNFISDRYGKENIINNAVHYDEGGMPHIHVVFCPVTKIDHEVVHHKTTKTTKAVKLESGRYEFMDKFKLDENGEKIKLKNYAKMSDYYDEKIDCKSVLNKIELKNFHQDMQVYLKEKGIDGAVINGKTGGVNYSVKELKEFTAKTGLTLEQIEDIQGDSSILEKLVEQNTRVQELEDVIAQKDRQISELEEQLQCITLSADEKTQDASSITQDRSVSFEPDAVSINEMKMMLEKNKFLENRLAILEEQLVTNAEELELAERKLSEYEKIVETPSEEWGKETSWGEQNQVGWNVEEEKEVVQQW